jgi:uncharacterized protein YukE
MEKYNTEEILRESQENVKKLNKKLKDIETLHNEIKESVNLSLKNPILFKELASKLNGSVELYLEGNNTIFEGKIVEISTKITELDSEINRLVEFSLDDSFKELETQFLENSKNVIGQELMRFDDKATNIQNKINDFSEEITRLSKIDLESHFNNHQSKLSEIFISVNGINGIISNISQTLNKISQNIGEIEQSIVKKQNEIIDSLQNKHEELLIILNKSENKIVAIISQNELLKKGVKVNKIIGVVMMSLIVVTLIVLLLQK